MKQIITLKKIQKIPIKIFYYKNIYKHKSNRDKKKLLNNGDSKTNRP